MSVLTKNMALNIPAHFFRLAGTMIDRVQINQIRLKRRDGRLMWVKRRRRGSRALARWRQSIFPVGRKPGFRGGRRSNLAATRGFQFSAA